MQEVVTADVFLFTSFRLFFSFKWLFPWFLASLNFLPIKNWILVSMQHKLMTVFKGGSFVDFFATYTAGGRTPENHVGVHRNSNLSFVSA